MATRARLETSATSAPQRIAGSGVAVVHELPGRLRLRLPALADPRVSAGQLEAWLDAVDVVRHVRVNRVARSVVVEYRAGGDAREAVLHRLDRFRVEAGGEPPAAFDGEAGVVGLVTALATLALLPILPAAGKRMLTLLDRKSVV